MREEISNWIKQAEADLEKAIILHDNKKYDGAVFFSQQSAEKALKSLSLLKLKEISKGHSIIYLSQKLKVPDEMLSGIRDLNPEYLTSRYPDMALGVPAESYDEKISQRHIKVSKDVIEWVKKQMQK